MSFMLRRTFFPKFRVSGNFVFMSQFRTGAIKDFILPVTFQKLNQHQEHSYYTKKNNKYAHSKGKKQSKDTSMSLLSMSMHCACNAVSIPMHSAMGLLFVHRTVELQLKVKRVVNAQRLEDEQ